MMSASPAARRTSRILLGSSVATAPVRALGRSGPGGTSAGRRVETISAVSDEQMRVRRRVGPSAAGFGGSLAAAEPDLLARSRQSERGGGHEPSAVCHCAEGWPTGASQLEFQLTGRARQAGRAMTNPTCFRAGAQPRNNPPSWIGTPSFAGLASTKGGGGGHLADLPVDASRGNQSQAPDDPRPRAGSA